MTRRDRFVVGGCAILLTVQAVPLIILWAMEGPESAGDAALVGVSSPALAGVAGFAVGLAAGLATLGFEPVEPSPGPVVERGIGANGAAGASGPHRPTSTKSERGCRNWLHPTPGSFGAKVESRSAPTTEAGGVPCTIQP